MDVRSAAMSSGVVDVFAPAGDPLHLSLRAAAEAGPLVGSGAGIIVLRYDDVEVLARDPRVAGIGLALFDLMGIGPGPLRDWYGGLMFTNEGETHDRLRKLVSRAFTPRSVEALRDATAAEARSALDGVTEAGAGDLVESFGLLAMRVMCRLLGVPSSDVAVFGAWADALSPIFGLMEPHQVEAADDAIVALLAYVEDLAERRRTDPGDDLITRMLAAEDEGDVLTHDELTAMVANLLVGGHDTTTSQLGCSMLTLLTFPEEAVRLRDDPSLLVSAVEETIRFEPSIVGVPRTVLEPFTLHGTDLAAGTVLILCTAAANREPGRWDDPDRFDVGRFARKGAPGLLSFGAGAHYCLGAALARLTVQECLRALADRIDGLTLQADPADLEWRVVLGRSPARLPVALA